jgi:hypothetical protein
MTPQEFDAALAQTRLKSHTAAAARAVLVDGLGLTQAGNAATPRMQRQQVADAVSRIEREHLRNIGAPMGWRCITLVLPWYGEEWEAARALQEQAYARTGMAKGSEP